MEEKNHSRDKGPVVSFILLDEISFSIPQFLADLKEDWDIVLPKEDWERDKDMYVTEASSWGGSTISVALVPSPVPDDCVIENAKTNFRWPDAVEVARSHKAHVIVAVLPKDRSLDSCVLLVELCSTALRQQHAVGINTLGTVFSPKFYQTSARAAIENNRFPIMNLVFFGIYSKDNGQTFCGYTYGLGDFGKMELEILDSRCDHSEVLEFLISIAEYIIVDNVLLQDGETIGFSEDQKLPITESPGQALDENTLKIKF